MENKWDIVVIGGGHAGIEAAQSSALMGCRTLMISMQVEAIGRMSCNPAIGGVAKGQLVRDIDALGGVMGLASDAAGIQFRMLNRSKGPAVWGPRAQMDMDLYAIWMQEYLSKIPNLTLRGSELHSLVPLSEGYQLKLSDGSILHTKKLIITSGTFLGAVMYTGLNPVQGGRIGEAPANELAKCLKSIGLKTRRLKTGTPSRLDKNTIDFSKCTEQPGDEHPVSFSFRTEQPLRNDHICWITYTNSQTHDILREGFEESPMFSGKITGVGPRYCPSIEDKINRFSDKDLHQLFLEPEGVNNNRIYVNGFSSSLPAAIQDRALRTIPGLANCKVLRYGYAVEYDAVDARQLSPSLECIDLPGLFFAGQVNGTSGYEEAAGQGLIAGINAALSVKGQEPFVLARSESYIGVMIDDLISQDTPEPYRMFTSRSEYRLFLRHDNAEHRLLQKGHQLGLVSESTYTKYLTMQEKTSQWISTLKTYTIPKKELNPILVARGLPELQESEKAASILRRPHFEFKDIENFIPNCPKLTDHEKLFVQSEISYEGFLNRQSKEIERNQNLTHLKIPPDFNFDEAKSLRIEARQILKKLKPTHIAQCQKVAGVTPADISGLIYLLTHRPSQQIVST